MTGRVLCIGECMVEFAPRGEGLFQQGFAGDTFNSAWYLRQVLPRDWQVDYLTALGDDAMSDAMAAFMAQAGIGTTHVRRRPGMAPGLYVISVSNGERSFSYWRGQSAARGLADDPALLDAGMAGAGLILLSGITLAILPEAGRANLLAALARARAAGAVVAFDSNIRPRLWPDKALMRAAITQTAQGADILLPSFDDESAHFGDVTPESTAARYAALGVPTVVVKNGAGEVLVRAPDGETRFTPSPVARIVDTTAAGDSFNAAFLAARLTGADMASALARGAETAAQVIGTPGALVRLRT